MNSLNPKVALSALGIIAVLASPAFAEKRQQRVTHVNQSEVSNVIPGYDQNGATVAIPDPDQR